jgi:hypothetical protein
MVSSEVQRTLVKSPPELWAELSDPASLARHLGELGEIRIVRTEPETTIEWEGENLTGTVSIKPSGWGTKVTLTVTRDEPEAPPESEAVDATNEDAPAPGSTELLASPQSDAEPEVSPESTAVPEPSPEPAVSATAAPEASPEPATSQPEPPEPTDLAAPEQPKRGFFARIFGRRRRQRVTAQEPAAHETLEPTIDNEAESTAQAGPEPASTEWSEREPLASDAFAAVSEVLAPQTLLSSSPFAQAPHAVVTAADDGTADETITAAATITADEGDTNPKGRAASDLSAELKAAEEIAADEVTAVLTAVLDRLGAAHHRPFSRA